MSDDLYDLKPEPEQPKRSRRRADPPPIPGAVAAPPVDEPEISLDQRFLHGEPARYSTGRIATNSADVKADVGDHVHVVLKYVGSTVLMIGGIVFAALTHESFTLASIGLAATGTGFALLCMSGRSTSEKKGYRF